MSSPEKSTPTQLSLHSVRNILGERQQYDLFTEQDANYAKNYGIELNGKIDRFGVDLTEIQTRVMEGILHGFSRTNYKGNVLPKSKEYLENHEFSGSLPPIYKYINEIPVLRATQNEIIEWSGLKTDNDAYYSKAIQAIAEISTMQFCFLYDRLAYDNLGKPIKDKDGTWKKEEVIAVDTLFKINEVRESDSKYLKYYEITPSPLFLDQRESYFLMVPNGWREEAKAVYGNKKVSSYTFRFLLFLRYQYELKRRKRAAKPYKIMWSPEEIAVAIKMSPKSFLNQKKRSNQILQDAYEVAKQLGYLVDYERLGHIDVLTLDDKKYFSNTDIELNQALGYLGNSITSEENILSNEISEVVDLFHKTRRQVNEFHKTSSALSKKSEIKVMAELCQEYTRENVEGLIQWSAHHKFWGSKITSVSKLAQYFSEAWTQRQVEKAPKKSIKTPKSNREFSQWLCSHPEFKNPTSVKIEFYSKYIEIGNGPHARAFLYEDPSFQDDLIDLLKRHQCSLPSQTQE